MGIRKQCLSEGSRRSHFHDLHRASTNISNRICDACQLLTDNASMSLILPRFRSRERTPGTMASQARDVSPAGSPAPPASESTALTGEAASYPAYPQVWLTVPHYVYNTIKATLYCSKANILLVFIPLSIIAAAREWNPVAVFALSFFAMFPLAELLSWSTEQLSASTGQVIGGLLMAAFGNAVEMIVSRACTTLLKLMC
jgi:hypothetical protein